MKDTFTVKGAFKEARALIKPQLWRVVGQYAWILTTFLLLNILAGSNLLLGIVMSALYAFATALFALGYAKRGSFSFRDFAQAFTFQAFAYFFLAYLVAKIFVIAGMVLLVIPGIMLAVWLCFVNFIAAEREVGPWDACKESARLTRGYRWQLLGFFAAALLFNLLGFVCLIVGLFYTLPVTMIALALIYKKLCEAKDFVPEIVEVVETEDGDIIDVPVVEVPAEEIAEVV